MKAFFSNRNFLSSVVSIVLSLAFVASVAVASTTISTNVQTDGTLSVTGASTLTGAVTVAGVTTASGQLQASSTALFGGNVTTYAGVTVGSATVINSLDGTILFKAQSSDPTGVTQGTIYYNSTSKVLKLFDGTSWFTTGTTTSGISLSGARLQLADLTTQFFAVGTTSVLSSAVVTLEATTTTSIPLVLSGILSQTGDLFNIRSNANAKLLYVTSGGNLFATGTAQVTGAFTTYGATTLGDAAGDTVTLTGNASALGTLNVTGLTTLGFASTTAISLNGANSNLMVNGMATTTASTGNFGTTGKIGAGTTTPTTLELSADGTATTTVAAFSSTTLVGGCIQLEGANDTMYRIYIGGTGDAATTTPSGKVGFILVAEAGSCK